MTDHARDATLLGPHASQGDEDRLRRAEDHATLSQLSEWVRSLVRRVDHLEAGLYGDRDRDGLRAEIKSLQAQSEARQRETQAALAALSQHFDLLRGSVDAAERNRMPRWIALSFWLALLACAAVIAAMTCWSVLRG